MGDSYFAANERDQKSILDQVVQKTITDQTPNQDYQNNDLSLDATMDIISPIKKPRGDDFMNTVEQFAVTDSMIESRTKNVQHSPRYKQIKLPKVTLKNGADVNIMKLTERIGTERPSVVEKPRKTFGDIGKFSLISNEINQKKLAIS